MEGGANVISEAVAASVPIVASRISDSIGLLGDHYPGYFPVGDTEALAALLERAETEPPFYQELQARCARLAPLVEPEGERQTWEALLRELQLFRSRMPPQPPSLRTAAGGMMPGSETPRSSLHWA